MNTTYEYDGMSRLTRLKDASTTATLFDRQYSYNNANQISQIVEPTVSRTFGYDNIDRLISVTNPVNGNESYAFDGVGNRTSSHRSSSYGYQSFNRLTSTNTATYNYDANGNMVNKSEGSNFWRYTWEYDNRMGSASTRKQSVRYKYDALGRRVQRNFGFGKDSTKFIYEGMDVLADDNAGILTKYQNGPGIDNKLRQTIGSSTSYFLSDHLGSTNGLADSTGALTSQTSYDSFGNSTNSSFPSRYQFTGREFDNFAGLQYSRARFYDPNLGRFLSEDPIGFRGRDSNLYGYTVNNPTRWIDPMGKDIWGVATGVSGAIGPGDGVAASGSTLYGFSGTGLLSDDEFDLGTASNLGFYSGNGSLCPTGEVYGFGGGFSFSLVGSNARNFKDLQGPFDTHFIGLGPVFVEIDIGTADDGYPVGVGQIGISPPALSIGKFGYANYGTYTPPESVGTARGLVRNIGQGISNAYGAPYRF